MANYYKSQNYKPKEPRYIVNEAIRGDTFRVVLGKENLGIISREEALKRAKDEGLDLVLIAPKSVPQVCKIVSLSKFKYQEQQKRQKSKSKTKKQELKEFRVGINTGDHDLGIRVERARKFLKQKDKVRFTLKFKGREIVHTHLGFERINAIIVTLEDIGKPEAEPKLLNKMLSVTLIPK